MAFLVQKEKDMGQFNIAVKVSEPEQWDLVREDPQTTSVNVSPIDIRCPNLPSLRVNGPREDILYLLFMDGGQLQIREVPIG